MAEGREAIKRGAVGQDLLAQLREISVHYAKKGDLLYPHLKVKYGISGPSAVMWTSDDEIRDELAALAKKKEQDEEWLEEFERVLVRMEEMIYKGRKNFISQLCEEFYKTGVVWNLSGCKGLWGMFRSRTQHLGGGGKRAGRPDKSREKQDGTG